MANTNPTFFRRFEVFASIQSGKNSRLEPVTISVGFTGSVDSDSGMILNLADIDQWIATFKNRSETKTYATKWALCQRVRSDFVAIVKTRAISSLRFSFTDLDIHFDNETVTLLWKQNSLIKSGKLNWISPTALALLVTSAAWPPISKATEKNIREKLKSVSLKKNSWIYRGLEFSYFEYTDPRFYCKIRC